MSGFPNCNPSQLPNQQSTAHSTKRCPGKAKVVYFIVVAVNNKAKGKVRPRAGHEDTERD